MQRQKLNNLVEMKMRKIASKRLSIKADLQCGDTVTSLIGCHSPGLPGVPATPS